MKNNHNPASDESMLVHPNGLTMRADEWVALFFCPGHKWSVKRVSE